MSNDLSRQLCELCGIEGKCVNCGQTVSDENPCPKPCDRRKYPDFTKPENFVRLLELKPYGARTIFYIVTKTVAVQHLTGIYNRNDFIFCLKCCLDESIKQSIREAEWVYD